MAPPRRRVHLGAVLLLLLMCAASAPVRSRAAAGPETREAWRLRGTTEPLRRPASPVRTVLSAAAFVPRTAVWLLARPIVAVVGFNERHNVSGKIMGLFTREVEFVSTEVAAFLGYETGFGMTVLGLRIHSPDWYGTGLDNRFRFSYLHRRRNIVELKLAGNAAAGWTFHTRSRHERKNDRAFYGFGLEPDDGASYDSQLFLNELRLQRVLVPGYRMAVTFYSRDTHLLAAEADDLGGGDLEVRDARSWTQASDNHYIGVEAEFERDTRDRGEMATRGSLLRLAAGWNGARSADDADYRHLTAEVQFHQVLFRDRSLAARVFIEHVDPNDRGKLPFSELRGLGGGATLRGYARDRFVDTNLLAVALEYRYPITKGFQGRLISDWGTVATAWDELAPGRMTWSGGLGLALVQDDDLFVIQYARGDEGGHFFLGTSTPFGFSSRRKR